MESQYTNCCSPSPKLARKEATVIPQLCRGCGDFPDLVALTLASPHVMALVAATLVLSWFLCAVVIPHADCRAVFVVGCGALYLTYSALDRVLGFTTPAYRQLDDAEKKYYVLSNLIKSIVLAALLPKSVETLVATIARGEWDNTVIRNMGSLYAITDVVSLAVVRRMKWTTILHHVSVAIFNAYSMASDYRQETVCRCIMVYGIFSAFAYLVNLLLASRFLRVTEQAAAWLSALALAVYSLACLVNWSWQLYYIRRLFQINPHWSLFVYTALIMFVVWDDVVLNRWLCNNCARLLYSKQVTETAVVLGEKSD